MREIVKEVSGYVSNTGGICGKAETIDTETLGIWIKLE